MPLKLTLHFEVLTPLYLGGADQAAELRPPAFKGLLRFWYRAVDPRYRQHEDTFFGGTAEKTGQSRFLLRTEGAKPETVSWEGLGAGKFSQGRGRDTRNGLIYLGFPFQMHGNEGRTAIAPGCSFHVSCLLPRVGDGEDARAARRRLTAAWWLLAHLGAAGSRSRRGFGALALTGWEADRDWPELAELPLLATASSPEAGRAALQQGLAVLRDWFGGWPPEQKGIAHPHLGPAFRFKVLDTAYGHSDWAKALAEMGSAMQEYRLRRAPDYQMVKDHVLAMNRQGDRVLQATPPRGTFGLPLTFRYSSVKGAPVMVVPFGGTGQKNFERHGSLLLLRPVAIGGKLYPLYVRMDGAVPGIDPPGAVRGQRRGNLFPAGQNAMDAYFHTLGSGKRA